ncbi:tubulin-specific chaperone c [Fonsecaea pedrosoi]|nr:tubulin-specific chaperone c [Fonsecaea pedrosoi]
MEPQNQARQVAEPLGELSHQQRFFNFFQHEITALQDEMDRLSETALIGGERSDAMDHCLAGITRLSGEVKDASGYIPPYDQRTYGEAIKALQEKLDETRKSHAPKPKFSFKSKSPSALSLSDAAELAAEKRRNVPGYLSPSSNPSFVNTPSYVNTPANERAQDEQESIPGEHDGAAAQEKDAITINTETKAQSPPADPAQGSDRPSLSTTATSTSISNQSNTHIILPSSAPNTQTPCSLSKLSGCVVDLSIPTTATAPFASITITTVSSSLILCGSVAGPAHITGVKNSVLVLKCRQFRMHDCENVDVYLHCTSRPIIEDCKGIRFAVLPKFHSDLISASQEDPSAVPNQWNQIDDFKWLSHDKPSPNWSLLPAEDIVPDETWREVVPGGPGWSVSDILKAVGVGGTAGST